MLLAFRPRACLVAGTTVLLVVGSCRDATSPSAPGAPARLEIVGGDAQEGVVGEELPAPLVVRVLDASGRPVPNRVVNFVVTRGGGHVFAGAAQSDDEGRAQERWTLGTSTADSQKVEVRAVDQATGAPLVFGVFVARPRPAAPAGLERVAGDSQSVAAGSSLRDSLLVRVVDRYRNPVPNVAVTWRVTLGEGVLSTTSTTTDTVGRSWTRLTTGKAAGENRVTATVVSLPVLTFVAHGIPGGVATVVIAPDSIGVSALQATAQFGATARDANNNIIADAQLEWQSLDAPASIDNSGLARALAPGRARIVAAVGGRADTAIFSVTQQATILSLTPTTHTFNALSDTLALVADVRDGNGYAIAGALVDYWSAAPDVASVDAQGRVISRRLGSTRIVASFSGAWDSAEIVVRQLAVSLTLSPTSASVAVGESVQLTATAVDSRGVNVADRSWESSNTGVASVDQTGLVRGVSPGTAVITVSAGTRTAASSILVTASGTALRFVMVSSGWDYSCALTSEGAAFCWGSNATGQLGTDAAMETCPDYSLTVECSTRPVAVAGGHRFAMINAAGSHACAVTTDGEGYCWGADGVGQTGGYSTGICNGITPCVRVPRLVTGGQRYSTIAGGNEHTCAIATSNDAYCFGRNYDGQLGDGTSLPGPDSYVPVRVAGARKFTAIAAGYFFSCAIDDKGAAFCWGAQHGGSTPTPLPGTGPGGYVMQSIDAEGHQCALATDAQIYCFTTGAPNPEGGPHSYASFSLGDGHMCGIDTQMDAYCRGDNTYGQLGTGLPPGLPAIVVGGHKFLALGAGGRHTCGVTTAGALWCWGSNDKGALGIGVLPNPADAFTLKRETPAEVAAPR